VTRKHQFEKKYEIACNQEREKKTMAGHDNLLEVGDLDFAAKVLQADLPVIVEFSASWCPHCHALEPVLAKLSKEEYRGVANFVKTDVDENPDIATHFGIQGMPTLLLFHAGKEIGRLIGPHPSRVKRNIEAELAEHHLLTGSHSQTR
jgi:thioredoxin 1